MVNMSFDKVMFCVIISIYLILNNTPTTHSLKNKIKPCSKIHSCTCIFPTGRGINLSRINQTLSVPINNNVSITVHLCSDISIDYSVNSTYNQCHNVSNLELQSMHACVRQLNADEGPGGGLSTGSVLIILFLVLVLAYFGGGMLTLRLLRGAEGKEMIPNIEFWTDLPYLVRDGILFVLNGFQPSASYDRI